MNEIETYSTKPDDQKKYATLRQLTFDRRYRKREIEQEVRDLELKFETVNKLKDPVYWYELQDRLGHAYMKLMNWWKRNKR